MANETRWPDHRARHIMCTDVITVGETASISEAMRLLVDNRISGMPVTDERGHLVGIVSFRDLLEALSATEEDLRFSPRNFYTASDHNDEIDYVEFEVPAEDSVTRVAEVMNAQVLSVASDAPLREIAAMMVEHDVHRLLVADRGKHVGLITTTDILRALVDD